MAFTEFGTGSDQAVKRWSDMLFRETFGKMGIRSLIGKGPQAAICLKTELDKSAGDQIKYDLLTQDRSNGINGDSRLKGFESALTYHQDDVKINQKRHAHAFKGMSAQRSVHDLRKDGRFSLSEWWSWFIEAGLMAHLAGVAGTGEETVVGALGGDTGGTDFAGNPITAPDANHLVATGNPFTLSDIDECIAKAKVHNPRVAPLKIGGMERYVMYLQPYTVMKMRTEVNDSAAGWLDIHKNVDARSDGSPIYSGALGVYNGVILRESEFVPRSGTNLTHNIMLGAGAGAIAFGNAWAKGGSVSSPFAWREETDDYDNEKGTAGVSILGFKGSQFNSESYGRIILRTTDPATL